MIRFLLTLFFGCVFAIGGGAVFVSKSALLVDEYNSLDWLHIQGNVIKSEVCVDASAKNKYFPCVAYVYTLNEKKYGGDKIWLHPYRANKKFAENAIAPFPVGANIPIFVNAQNPSRATLVAGPQGITIFGVVLSAALTAVGMILIVHGVRRRRQW